MQTHLEKWKAILQFIIYLNRIKVLDRMNNICLYNFERSEKDDLMHGFRDSVPVRKMHVCN